MSTRTTNDNDGVSTVSSRLKRVSKLPVSMKIKLKAISPPTGMNIHDRTIIETEEYLRVRNAMSNSTWHGKWEQFLRVTPYVLIAILLTTLLLAGFIYCLLPGPA